MSKVTNLVVWACGGAGTNVAKQISDLDITVNFIDASASNMKGVNSSNIFLIEGLDGAGKRRATAHDKFKNLAEDVLIKMKASDSLNVVISSLSGGELVA